MATLCPHSYRMYHIYTIPADGLVVADAGLAIENKFQEYRGNVLGSKVIIFPTV